MHLSVMLYEESSQYLEEEESWHSEADVLEISLCAEQTTSYLPGVHGPLVARSVLKLPLLNTAFVAFYTNIYKSIS